MPDPATGRIETVCAGAASDAAPRKTDDAALLCLFAEERSEAAFAELVHRYVDLVHSAALRRCGGDGHLAKDVVQRVFIALAKHAGKLARHPALAAWLFTATRNAATNALVAEQRRRARETAAMKDEVLLRDEEGAADWSAVRPVLDQAMDELNETDRTAVLLRYFERRSYADIGARLRLTENGARMRTERALEKLRERLAARGIKSAGAALGVVLTGHAVAAAPPGLAAAATGAALGAGFAVSLLVLLKWLGLFAKSGWVWGAGAAVLVSVVGYVSLRPVTNPPTVNSPRVATNAVEAKEMSRAPARGGAGLVAGAPSRETNAVAAEPRRVRDVSGVRGGEGFRPAAFGYPAASAFLQAMAQAYRAVSSYQDTGVVRTCYSDGRAVTHVCFGTTFSRVNRLRFQWTQGEWAEEQTPLPLSVAWYDGARGGVMIRGSARYQKFSDPNLVVAEVWMQTSGAVSDIPALLTDAIRGSSLAELQLPELSGEEEFEGTACFRLNAVNRDGRQLRLWIGKSDFLIRKIASAPKGSAPEKGQDVPKFGAVAYWLEEVHRDIRINAEIPAETFDVKPPGR